MPTCNWEVTGTSRCDAFTNLEPAEQTSVEEWAVNRLWEWTGRRFGPCEVSVRPCRQRCGGYGIGGPVLDGGRFTNLVCGSCGDDCSCQYVSEVILPGPIAEPTEILIDGVELSLDAVRVDDWRKLVRIDGGRFPTCQDVGKEPDEVGTWQVTYLRGEAIPPGGELVAGALACEYAKSLCGDKTCRLPKRLTSVSRQGLTMAMIDDFKDLKEGGTGIWEIDDWIMTQNRAPRQPRVTSPDIPRHRETTWSYAAS